MLETGHNAHAQELSELVDVMHRGLKESARIMDDAKAMGVLRCLSTTYNSEPFTP